MKQQFIVKVESIPTNGLQLKLEWDIRTVEEILQQDVNTFKSCSPLSLNLSFALLGEKIIIEGGFQTIIRINCVSCLSEFKQPLEADFRYILWPQSTASVEAEQELQQEDMEIGYYQGGVIDLWPLVAEQMYLALPQNPHCHEGCQGLCPSCGTNLNEKQCTCSVTARTKDSPFAVLKNFKKHSGI
jgi:uncharacterized protein